MNYFSSFPSLFFIVYTGDDMQINIQKHYFYKLDGISTIKTHIDKINKVEIDKTKAIGEIEINVSYTDYDGMECFKVLPFTFDLELEELNIIDVHLAKVNVAVVEGQGVDIEYILVISYFPSEEEKVIEVEPITENIIFEQKGTSSVEPILLEEFELPLTESNTEQKPDEEQEKCEKEEDIEKIKEDIAKNYEDKLADSLATRENVQVISTKSHQTTEDFLSFFASEEKHYYVVKCLHVEKEEDLNQISKDYKIPLSKLLAGYDRSNHNVLFSIDESASI